MSLDYINHKLGQPIYDEGLESYALGTFYDNHYGASFSALAMYIEYSFDISDFRQQYLLRHYMVNILFFIGLICLFLAITRGLGSSLWGIVAVILIQLSPRVFGQSFYNPKDTLFLAGMMMALYTHIRFFDKTSFKNAIIHGRVKIIGR